MLRNRSLISLSPNVPPSKPAAIEPVILPNGRLGLSTNTARFDLNEGSVRAAFAAVKSGFAELAQDAEDAGNIDHRSIRELKRISDRIPLLVPTQEELFRLGHVEALLNGYASTVNDEWPQLLAKKYHAINRMFDDTIRQFPEWREFKRNAAQDDFSAAQISTGVNAGDLLAEDLEADESIDYVDQSLPNAIRNLAADLKQNVEQFFSYISHKFEVALDLVESLSNTIKSLCKIALGTIGDFGGHYLRGVRNHIKGRAAGFEKRMTQTGPLEGSKDADSAARWARRILIHGPWITLLITHFPSVADWLPPIVAHLRSIF